MYNSKSKTAEEFISDSEILETLKYAQEAGKDEETVQSILNKAALFGGLTHREAAVLLAADEKFEEQICSVASSIKNKIYGNRIVMFAPLYLSDYCVNECGYCGYRCSNKTSRRKLTQEEIKKEVEALQRMGHKRLALETGEDPVNCPIDYVLESIKTIYSVKTEHGEIRRVNVNIAATTVENYAKLKDAGIGTYILFQESYHKPTYKKFHKAGPKHRYSYHTEAMDRAMEGGVDDVGVGVLFGLYDYKYETVAMLMHAEHLSDTFGVGPHTMSVPRICPAPGVNTDEFPHLVNDNEFKRIIAVLRCAVPYTGLILSTREQGDFRDDLLKVGISQISAGSATGVGGYSLNVNQAPQFEIHDHRSLNDMVAMLSDSGYIPSFCTACYREGRTGERFMRLAKTGQISNVCLPNALLTLKEYLLDYADEKTKVAGLKLIENQLNYIDNNTMRAKAELWLEMMDNGERDFRV